VRQIGTPLELYHLPETIFVAGFIGSPKMNFFAVYVLGVNEQGVTVAAAGLGATLIPVEGEKVGQGDRLVLGIRPEHLGTGIRAASMEVTVQLVERLGHETIVQTVAPGGQGITGLLGGEAMVSVGQGLKLHFAPENAHLFREDGDALRRRMIPEIVAMSSRKVAPAGL
jgi:multiple sugar transport system ATP-binding protein